MDKIAKYLVAAMSVECLAVSAGFAWSGNWKLAAYWLAVSTINAIAYTF